MIFWGHHMYLFSAQNWAKWYLTSQLSPVTYVEGFWICFLKRNTFGMWISNMPVKLDNVPAFFLFLTCKFGERIFPSADREDAAQACVDSLSKARAG